MQSLLQYRRLRRRADEDAQKELRERGLISDSEKGDGQTAHRDVEDSDHSNESGTGNEQTDLTDPHQWSYSKRLGTTSIVWILVFALGWNSTCDSTILKHDSEAFHVSQEAETLPTALFFFGISLGSLFAGPISETVGRNPVYLISTSICICFTLGSALAPNLGAQIAFRFLSGLASSPTLSMYGGSLADLFSPTERATIWPVFALSPLLGESSMSSFCFP